MVLQYSIWGDSVALCLPRELAQKIHATAGAHVDLTIEDGKVILSPIEAMSSSPA
jgi:antitoxin component of MazEF toxin-antitoxin module